MVKQMKLYLKHFGVAARSFVGVTQSRSPLVPRRGEGGAGEPGMASGEFTGAALHGAHCTWQRMAMPHGRCMARHDRLRRFCTIAQSQQLGETETCATNETKTDRIAKTMLQLMANRLGNQEDPEDQGKQEIRK